MNQRQALAKFDDMVNVVKNKIRIGESRDAKAEILATVEFVRTLHTNGVIGPDEHGRLIRVLGDSVFRTFAFE